jgi:hypothetical protein
MILWFPTVPEANFRKKERLLSGTIWPKRGRVAAVPLAGGGVKREYGEIP